LPRRLAIALSLLSALVVVPVATATTKGPCEIEFADQDVSGRQTGPLDDPITVPDNGPLSVITTSDQQLGRLKVEIEFAGIQIEVNERATTGTRWASEVKVDEYAVYGRGLYKVVATTEGRGFTCEGSALVDVEGDDVLDPLVTVAGVSGLGMSLLGLLGLLSIALRVGRSRRSAPLAGMFLGAILGVGVGVLLQQFSVLYPTVGVTGALIAGGAALGLLFSLFGLPGRGSDAVSTRG